MLSGCELLDALTVNLFNQTKTLSAALFLYVVMGLRQSKMQLFALFLMLISAVILTTPDSESLLKFSSISDISKYLTGGVFSFQDQKSTLGILFVGGASMISGLSTALTQNALSKGRPSMLLNAELSIFSVICLLVSEIFQHGHEKFMHLLTFEDGGLFQYWTWWTLIPVLTSAVGGIIVGLVTKYAGGVSKGFALIAGIIVTAIVEYIFDGKPLGSKHIWSAGLVSLSIWIHSSFKFEPKNESRTKKE